VAERRLRTTTLALAALLAATATVGCEAVEKALDCGQSAVAVSDSINDLQQVVSDAGENPLEAEKALNEIDKNLDALGGKTADAEVGKAVDDLAQSVKDVREAIEAGGTPDLTPVTTAADKLTQVCSPG
jgi:hypothetical protein